MSCLNCFVCALTVSMFLFATNCNGGSRYRISVPATNARRTMGRSSGWAVRLGSPKVQLLRLPPFSHSRFTLPLIRCSQLIRLFDVSSEKVDMRASILRSEEHTSELKYLMRISYAVIFLKKNKYTYQIQKQRCSIIS